MDGAISRIRQISSTRFIGTLVSEWACARRYRSNAERLAALPAFVDFCNPPVVDDDLEMIVAQAGPVECSAAARPRTR